MAACARQTPSSLGAKDRLAADMNLQTTEQVGKDVIQSANSIGVRQSERLEYLFWVICLFYLPCHEASKREF